MKLLLSICLLGMSVTAFGQLTRGQVYDFQPGDYLVVELSSNQAGATETYKYLDKWYSAMQDTVFYTVRRTISPTNTFDTIVQSYDRLDEIAGHHSMQGCLPSTHSTGFGHCDNEFATLKLNYDNTCFEPNLGWSKLIAGLGGPYYFYQYDGDGSYHARRLQSAYKSNWGSCWMGMEDNDSQAFKIGPNPAKDELSISMGMQQANYTVCALSGEILMSGEVSNGQSISLSALENGLYLLVLDTGNNQQVERIEVRR